MKHLRNDLLSRFGTLTGFPLVVRVSPDGTTIFSVPNTTRVQKITVDPANPSTFTVNTTYPISPAVGTVYRAVVSLDGNAVFVSGSNGIDAITTH